MGADLAIGSSPRVRGTVGQDDVHPRLNRFIPACAGNGQAESRRPHLHPVHPRVCGERSTSLAMGCRRNGSSPRVRGTDAASGVDNDEQRFIPACAGNGRSAHVWRRDRSVHPRVCGERSSRISIARHSSGSSPRGAGNGTAIPTSSSSETVHPRVCGERSTIKRRDISGCGSSPRVRGTASNRSPSLQLYRFIPACAGNGLEVMLLMLYDLYAAAFSTDNGQVGGSRQELDQRAPSSGGDAKQTSLSPSNSRGIRRLTPTVSKSKP